MKIKTLAAMAIIILLMACSNSNVKTANFKVWGNCNMCKETIETALKIDGVKSADWNTESKIINVSFDTTKITLDAIQKYIADAGYDNVAYKGNDAAYANLPECCQYDRKAE